MKFGQRVSIRNKLKNPEFVRGIWSPSRFEWRDIIESLITMSRRYTFNKLAMFKLQTWIVIDVINESEAVIKMKEMVKELDELKAQSKIDEEKYKIDVQHLKTEIESSRLTIAALKEIMDGVVWRYFSYNRALLYVVADKQPIDLVPKDKGLVNALFESADIFIEKDSRAILNDITNFLRIGDVTSIKEDGNIEFIEVKSSKKRGARFSRQKERMQETVEFFNTEKKDLDGRQFIITESNVRQKNYLKQLKDSILRARKIGNDSILVGSHQIVETTDFGSVESKDKSKAYFKSKHASVKDQWKKDGDFVFGCWAIEKLEYAKNYAPYTIFPFEDDIVADILMGKIWIHYLLNNNEVIRTFERGGWRLVESFLDIPEEEFTKPGAEDLTFYKLRKGEFTVSIPASWFGRLCFEMISPKVILNELDRQCEVGGSQGNVNFLPRFLDDERIWD